MRACVSGNLFYTSELDWIGEKTKNTRRETNLHRRASLVYEHIQAAMMPDKINFTPTVLVKKSILHKDCKVCNITSATLITCVRRKCSMKDSVPMARVTLRTHFTNFSS